MKIIWIALIAALLFGCTEYKEGEEIDITGKEVKLTILHTTDIHSKILPFQFTPNMWDKRLGLTPQDPALHCNCEEGTYPIGDKCLAKADATACQSNLDCGSNTPNCSKVYGVCYECTKDTHCNTATEYCLNYECVDKDETRSSCPLEGKPRYAAVCSGNPKRCYNDNGRQYYGGLARMGYVIEKERGLSGRSIYLDSGDMYQGAPIFNFFQGEAEMRAVNALKPAAQAMGNHEFDEGVDNWVHQAWNWSNYPILAANYIFNNPNDFANKQIPSLASPYTVIHRDGLTIGVVGLANTASMVSIGDAGNSMGINPESVKVAAQYYVDLLKHDVDLVVINSHAGLDVDQVLCKTLTDVDVIVGGHHHVFTYPAEEILNPVGEPCLMQHSGVNAKFLGVLEVVAKDTNPQSPGLEIISSTTRGIPIDNKIDEEVKNLLIKKENEGAEFLTKTEIRALMKYDEMNELLENYEDAMYQILNVDEVLGHAEEQIDRNDVSGGSSALGNLVADALREQEFIDADFSITNSLGIRADLPAGDIKVSKIYEIFPFNNTITTMSLSGSEVMEMLNFVVEKSSERGCKTQVQVSGISFTMNCTSKKAENVLIGGHVLQTFGLYEVATNDYMAKGGSGFDMLARVTTKSDRGISLRQAVMDLIRKEQRINNAKFEDSGDQVKRITPKRNE